MMRNSAILLTGAICLTCIGCGSPASTDTGNPGTAATNPADGPLSVPKAGSSTAKAKSGPNLVGDRMTSITSAAPNLAIPQEPSPFRFTDKTKDSGIGFVNFSGMDKEKYFPTANGSGVAVLDYDGDGLFDLYFCTATTLPLGSSTHGSNKLYRNLGSGKFEDVTEKAGVGFVGFTHGAIVGDIDNDGDPDLFLCNYGPNALYLNNGDGTFRNISKSAGIDRPGWSSSGAFLDIDNDGDLDLYVSNYGIWNYPDDHVFCGDAERKIRMYCSPRLIKTTKHFLYRNNGDGTFTDVLDAAKIGRSDGHGFGVVTADFNGDGKVDIYVANDMNPNFVFFGNGDGTFEDVTEKCGAAFDEKGQSQSGMGVEGEDVNGDGTFDLFVTNFQNEYNTFYENVGKGNFMDNTSFYGLAADSLPWVGWGCVLADFDRDGWPDLFVSNGHVDDNREELGLAGTYAEPSLLHRNLEGKRFKLATRGVGTYFDTNHVGRGVAQGDLDNDGDVDLVINHKDGPPAILFNETPTENRWLRVVLVGTKSNRDAIGTRLELEIPKRILYRQRKGGCSMFSSNDPRLTIGVGPNDLVTKLTVRWPSGTVQVLEDVKTNAEVKITEPKD